jgi:rRNA-processing protein FCF1
MRHGRAKAARKTLQFFARQGIRPPYVVILDGTFLLAAVLQKVPLSERLERILQHNTFYLKVTRSCLDELKALAEHPGEKQEALRQAWQWGLDECQILENKDIPKQEIEDQDHLGAPGQDIVKLVSSNHISCLVATQDEILLDVLRNKGLCPLLRLARGVLLLENPSKASQQKAQYEERSKYSAQPQERNLAQSVREEERHQRQAQTGITPRHRIKHKAKGPNPLSCKRKSAPETEPRNRKRTRKRNKGGESATT